jgi:hypothetical protein
MANFHGNDPLETSQLCTVSQGNIDTYTVKIPSIHLLR